MKTSKTTKIRMRASSVIFLTVILILSTGFLVTSTLASDDVYQDNLKIYSSQSIDSVTLEFYKLPQVGIESTEREIADCADKITNGISGGYAKIKAVYDWVADNIYYDWDAANSGISTRSTAIDTLRTKRGVCVGYSSLTAALLRASGVPAKYVTGLLTQTGERHAWCEAFADGRWVILDVTGASAVGNRYENGEFVNNSPRIEEWFDVSVSDISKTHKYDQYPSAVPDGMFKRIGVTSIIIPGGFTGIGTQAFYQCESLTEITLPSSAASIANGAFYECVNLKSVRMPGVENIGDFAFQQCVKLTDVIISDSLSHIGLQAFYQCESLTDVILPPSAASIGENAFANCANLQSITIPPNVNAIGENAFYGCPNLTVYGASDSFAESYALRKGINFIAVEFSGSTEMFLEEEDIEIGDNATPLAELRLPAVARPSAQKVLFNGKQTDFDAYNIDGSNYFKLRDLAYVLNGTEKQFSVGWDGANNAITLISGEPYAPVAGDMKITANRTNKTGAPTMSKIYLDGREVSFTAYNIDGANYFKLRDVMKTFDVYVGWDGSTNTITLDTSKGYVD